MSMQGCENHHAAYEPSNGEIAREERLTALARASSYAEELVEDDYLWTDASREYIHRRFRRLLEMLGGDKS